MTFNPVTDLVLSPKEYARFSPAHECCCKKSLVLAVISSLNSPLTENHFLGVTFVCFLIARREHCLTVSHLVANKTSCLKHFK